jgi:quercetin dioxygenase-like cupin family protein
MEANVRKTLVVHAGETREAEPLGIFGIPMWIKLSGKDTGGTYAIMEDQTPPEMGPPLHRHSREDESFYVLEGEYVFEVDGERIAAQAGSSVYAPKGTAHRFQNVGVTPGRLLIMVQPAGLDSFFVDIDEATRGAYEPDLSVVVPIFEKHGLELLGSPLPARTRRPSEFWKLPPTNPAQAAQTGVTYRSQGGVLCPQLLPHH